MKNFINKKLVQGVLLLVLIVAMVNYFVGVFIPSEFDPIKYNVTSDHISDKLMKIKQLNSEGHFGVQTAIAWENLLPAFSAGENFFTVFTIFFPATTGILERDQISHSEKYFFLKS